MQSTFDTSNEFPNFSLGLDTPSKFLQSSSPNPWALGPGLTPSFFGSLNPSRGYTPSITDDAATKGEANPFELSLGVDQKRHSIPSNALDPALVNVGKDSSKIDHDFDLLSTSTLFGGRKRAASSPAIRTPGGSSLDYLLQPSQQPVGGTLSRLHISPSKRPRMDSLQSSGLSSNDKLFSSGERESDDSPASSVVQTPPDAKMPLPTTKGAVDIPVGAGSTSCSPASFAPGASVAPTSASLLSQLEQQRSAMIAAGTAAWSQSAPLPMKADALDITVKPKPVDPSLAARPHVTRGSSRKGKAPAMASTNLTSEASTPAASAPKRKGGRRKSAAAKAEEAAAEQDGAKKEGEGEDDDEDSVKRKQFLERNRIAACKSRQKKKEKTAQLERLAAELCNRNHVLQQTALALRQEAMTLRQLMHAHQGCSCEHAQGYIARDQAGGGIATIDQLAGRTLVLDYSVPPSMGTEDDVYSWMDRGEACPGVIPAPSGSIPFAPAVAPGPAIPVAQKGGAAPHAPTSSPQRPSPKQNGTSTRSMVTRRSAANAASTDAGPTLVPPPMPPTIDMIAVQDSGYFGMEVDDVAMPLSAVDPTTQAILDMSFPKHVRASSAPPTTPGWDGAAPKDDYFAPKTKNDD
ncbi:uncharacterized protein JCM10292_000574 [Rhodotorula paludigena]|uniref:uncharacterized protein n=1 Tax=Rhodotorula paludigena TaxID=86838 RepID=UPI0031811AEE